MLVCIKPPKLPCSVYYIVQYVFLFLFVNKNLQLLISNLEEARDQGVPHYSLLIKRYFDGKCKNISYNQIIELNLPEQCAY